MLNLIDEPENASPEFRKALREYKKQMTKKSWKAPLKKKKRLKRRKGKSCIVKDEKEKGEEVKNTNT